MIKHNFSVLLPVYNRIDLKYTFPRCIEAIAGNSAGPKQIVIVCDGPLDWSIDEQLKCFEHDLDLTVVKLENNVGLAKALNIGLTYCRFDIVARVDADDFCRSDRFERQLAFFDSGFTLVGSNIQEIDEAGNFLKIRKVPEKEKDIKSFALRRNPFNHMTVMYRKSDVLSVGGYPLFYLKEDYALWVLLINKAQVRPHNIQESLMYVTAGDGMYSRRSSLKIMREEYRMQRFLRANSNKKWSLMILDYLIRCSFYLLPKKFKALLYENVLRG